MMYIEHTSLEDNLHHILTNRVPTSSSPGATEAAAVAASALLASERVVHNGAPTLNAPQVPLPQKPYFTKEWLRRKESKLLVPSLNKLPRDSKEPLPFSHDLIQPEKEDIEEEQYELLHVLDSDQQEDAQSEFQKPSWWKEERGQARKTVGRDSLPTTHFCIDLQDSENQRKTDDEEEFEYIVTRVPKRKNHNQSLHHYNFKPHSGSQGDNRASTKQAAPLYYPIHQQQQRPPKAKRPVPSAIPIQYHQGKLVNGDLGATELNQEFCARASDTSGIHLNPEKINGFPEPYIDSENLDYFTGLATTESEKETHCDNEYCKKDAQMGLDIISKIRQLFNWNQSSSESLNCAQHESKRKRRSDGLCDDSNTVHTIKYRKVDNRFPKYVAHTEEDEDLKFLQPPPPLSAQSSKPFQSDMSDRRSTSSREKPPLRKSMFSSPNIKKVLMKNTLYADINLSDDDEHITINPSTLGALNHMPKVYNIPIVRADERDKRSIYRPPPPPLIDQRTGNFLTSQQNYRQQIAYADAIRQNRFRELPERNGNVLGTRNSSISSSGGASTSASSRLHNIGMGSYRPNQWSNFGRSSILAQERESEQREKYQQLLEQVVPRLYGSSTENKVPTAAGAQRRISALHLDSSSRSSSVNARRSFGLNQSNLKRPQLSSTINLDDDDEVDDVAFGSVSYLKQSNRQSKPSKPTTIVIDDDEVSDIVELGTAERHVLSQVGKIQQQEKSMLSLCADKSKKPKNNALPYVEPVNSLRDRFLGSPHIQENWLDNWQSKWSLRKRNKLVEVQATAQVAEKLTAERKTAETEIQERLRKFQIVDPELFVVDDFEELISEPEFVELTEQHRARINSSVFEGAPDQVLVSKFNLNITRRDIHTLCGHSWLNDEVINFYMNLLTERGDIKKDQGLPSVYAMNTFFVPRLLQAGHAGVKRWTRKVDIFAKDIIPLPVHVGGVHWCMAIIHMKNRSIKYYDSMGTPNPTVLKALEQYLKDESLDKRKKPFDTKGFEIESVADVPRQMNGSDCGVFSCMFAEYITRGKQITFSQQNMEYFRQKMILEIVTGQLLQ